MIKRLIFGGSILAVAGFVVWVQLFGDQWLSDFNEERQLAAETQRAQGAEYGTSSTEQGCLDEALVKVNECRSPVCSVETGYFLQACWQTAQPTAEFCEGVPAFQEKITEEEKSWARYGCWGMNNKSDGCRLLMRQKQQLCEAKT